MNTYKQKETEILQAICQSETPLGAINLSEMLGIPSATVGRTLLSLEKRGFAAKNKNKGRVITENGKKYLNENLLSARQMQAAYNIIKSVDFSNEKSLTETLKVRRLLESYAAYLCAENCTQENIAALEEMHKQYTDSISKGCNGSEEDLKLHLMIASFSQNKILENMIYLLLTDESRYKAFSDAALCQNRLFAQEHSKIILAVKEKNPQKAKKEMEKHIDRVMQNIKSCI